jgi:hypothetical protein
MKLNKTAHFEPVLPVTDGAVKLVAVLGLHYPQASMENLALDLRAKTVQ